MGIVMTWAVPGIESGAVDPFDPGITFDRRVPITAVTPSGDPNALPGGYGCVPSATTLCLRGQVTHGHYQSSDHHGGCLGACPPFPQPMLPSIKGPLVTDIHWGGFTFGESDFSAIALDGVPRVAQGKTLTFWNADAATYMWHTATSCAFPCTVPTTVDNPISNGSYAAINPDGSIKLSGNPASPYVIGGQVDFDSSELGVGLGPSNRVSWGLDTSKLPLGVYTYYCRIHPSMRGAFEVVPSNTTS
jgi:plastocyanin